MGEETILDQPTIENLKKLGGDDFLHELIDLFIEHSPGLVQTINDGQPASDWDKVGRAAHSLKSSAGNIGAFALQTVASDLEQAANNSDLPTITASIELLAPTFNAVVEALKKLR